MKRKPTEAQIREQARDRKRAQRQRAALTAVSVAPIASPEPLAPSGGPLAPSTADDAVSSYLNAVVAWATVTRTPLAGRLAQMAGDLIEKYEPETEDFERIKAARRGMLGRFYDPG